MNGAAGIRLALAIALASSWGCGQSVGNPAASGASGASGASSASGASGAAALAGSGGTGGQSGGVAGMAGLPAASCPEVAMAHVGANAALELTTAFYFEGSALSPGQPNTLANGSVLTPLNLRFYVSNVALLRADGSSAPADLVDVAGTVVPYGLQLINSDDDSSLSMHLRGPAGSYTGISFTLGLDDSCNAGSIERKAPLSATSGMTWPPPFGYLFFRYEGMVMKASDETRPFPSAIHMGGLPRNLMAPVVSASGPLALSDANPTRRALRLMLDQVFAATMIPGDLGDFVGPPGDEVQAGERMRQAAPGLPLFVLVEP